MYSYGDSSWLDLLTAYDGQSISYDSIGNPTSWYDGTTFTWSNGCRLTSAVNSSTGLNNSYTYDMDGLRLTKTVGSVEHKYVWQGSKLVAEYFGGTELEFFYDENGSPYAFSYKATASATPVMYYYVTNLQGDVVSILNASGTSVAEYSYNAWGKVLSATGTMAAINPIRYRGYYFDSDSGLYYLKSRYYDPNLQRFINSDVIPSTGQKFIGANMFAYCLNNPVCIGDDGGYFANWLVGGLVGAAVGAISAVIKGENVAAGALQGAVSGAIAGAAVDLAVTLTVATGGGALLVAGGAVTAFLGGAVGSYAGEVAHAAVTGEKVNSDGKTLSRALTSGALNVVSMGTSSLLEGTKMLKAEPIKGVKDLFSRAFSGSLKPTIINGAKEIGYDIMSAFHAIQYSIQGGLLSDLFSRRR